VQRIDLGAWAPVLFFVLLVVGFSIASPSVFPTSGNIASILNDSAILAILACGLTVVLLCGEFDLSIGASASFGGALGVVLTARAGVPTPLAVVAVIAAGMLIGLLNGLLITYFGTPALIATLAVASILDGLTQLITDNEVIFDGIPKSFTNLGDWHVGEVAAPFFYLVVIAVLLWVMLRYTRTGRALHAVGGNRQASRMAGLRVPRYVIASFVISGTLGALGGMLYSARQGSLSPLFGTAFLLPAFAGAFLGSVTLRRGEFLILGTVIGIYLIGTGTTGLLIVGGPTYSQQLFSGAVLILATAGTRFLRQRVSGAARRPAREGGAGAPSAEPAEPAAAAAAGGATRAEPALQTSGEARGD
jgi:ribose transport system permease protein